MASGSGIGKRVGQLRLLCKPRGRSEYLNLAELGEILGVSASAVWSWENNDVTPRPATILKIAEIYGYSPLYIRTGIRQADDPELPASPELRGPGQAAAPAPAAEPLRSLSVADRTGAAESPAPPPRAAVEAPVAPHPAPVLSEPAPQQRRRRNAAAEEAPPPVSAASPPLVPLESQITAIKQRFAADNAVTIDRVYLQIGIDY